MIEKPLEQGRVKLKNRIVMPPIATYKSNEDGQVTDGIIEHYRERAAGGQVGLIVTEHSYINMQGRANAKQLSIARDSDVEGLKRLTDAIHAEGPKVIAQLNHAGSAAPSEVTGMAPVSASPVVLPTPQVMGDGGIPKELTEEEIKQVVCDFRDAAKRAKEAGYDGVEIHSAHAYLLNQFYSPLTNHRSDGYGGELIGRMRIHREVIQAVRECIGDEMIISLRLGGCDYMDGGSTIEDSVKASKLLEEWGVDMISVSGGMCRYTREGHEEPGYFSDMSREIKKALSIPVLLTGGVNDIKDGEELLKKGAADLIGVGRALMKDPQWAVKAMREFAGVK